MHAAHVFLGPSLDIEIAVKLFPNANYHPPVQCGDIIRLLRLDPALIVIIDGLYETTPAVWHKELLLALENGIEVWGAASMGALRAAELHHYGMHGFGEVFVDYKENILTDDDEVAVLHLDNNGQFRALNDAMVNIRATCKKAREENALTQEAQNQLLTYCKAQFYPYRSLTKALQHLSKTDSNQYQDFSQWLKQHGLVDVKKNDAILALQHIHSQYSSMKKKSAPQSKHSVMTCFLRELILFANTTPFKHNADWLPTIEQQIYTLHQQSPLDYMLRAEVVSFLQKLVVFSSEEKDAIDNTALIHYIDENQLYSPEKDFAIYKDHASLSAVYSLICQSICLLHLTDRQLQENLPALAHYYDLPEHITAGAQKVLKVILVLLFAINQQMKQPNLIISKHYLTHHLKQLKIWRHYTQQQFKMWLANIPVSRPLFTSLLHAYLMASSVHALSSVKVEYYQWIYDAQIMFNEHHQ
ncbi:TfuA-like protein [Legionella fallonii]|uniref:TfuA-like core domain-containing protein n=1 Tax=Legionella fallonii LLAP-10 TaxID=1212491 RepID=A0A098G189_9GAMM|nr:TfuA-like protein [Legionella fallonii]CEG55749.1 protein of unknown function [TfuA domain] [Legionella fallonii LLAP-10]